MDQWQTNKTRYVLGPGQLVFRRQTTFFYFITLFGVDKVNVTGDFRDPRSLRGERWGSHKLWWPKFSVRAASSSEVVFCCDHVHVESVAVAEHQMTCRRPPPTDLECAWEPVTSYLVKVKPTEHRGSISNPIIVRGLSVPSKQQRLEIWNFPQE